METVSEFRERTPIQTALPSIIPAVNDYRGDETEISFDEIEANARRLTAAGERDAAMSLVQKTAQQCPGEPRVRRMKGVVLLELRDYVAARIALSDAARRMPDDADSRFYYGVSLEYSGDSESAIAEYEAAIRLRPDYDAAREFLNALRNGSGQLYF